MAGKYLRKRKFPWFPVLVIVLLAVTAAGVVIGGLVNMEPVQNPTAETTVPETTVPPTTVPPTTVPPDPVVSTASFTVTGDLLMHKPVFNSCWDNDAQDWIFDPLFTYIAPYVEAADYAVTNLETTLRGPLEENGMYQYSGYPIFNCPDGIAPASRNAGFDMMLTGNNHCYDTGTRGVTRTLEILQQAGLETLGTQSSADEPDYKVVDVNGIKVGMVAYTYETSDGNPDVPSINAITCRQDAIGLISSFDPGQLQKFYDEIGDHFESMKAEGAEAIVVFMHWGVEYTLEPTDGQKQIAQKLCDMGVDVIVGGHPHVIEPVDLLTSTQDENHKTLIIYSTGNAVSNQRISEMRMKTGHTEDGILFNFTLAKYRDGSVEVVDASCVPTWVYKEGSGQRYAILPLEYSLLDQWQEMFQIGDVTRTACLDSYNRTMALVSGGLEKAQAWYDAAHEAKLEELNNPSGAVATEPIA